MTALTDGPHASSTKYHVAQGVGFIACLVAFFQKGPGPVQTAFIVLAVIAFICAGVLMGKRDKANKEWRKSQPDYVDPMEGKPDYPHHKVEAAFIIGVAGFVAFAHLGVPMMDRPLSSSDWWAVVPLVLVFAGFGYADRIQRKWGAAFTEWRKTHS